MTVRVVAILPKRRIDPRAAEAELQRYLRGFAREVEDKMSEYPPARPWRSRPPRTGPRAGGRRTGQYGSGWQGAARLSRSSVTIVNRVPYASAVGGSRRQVPGQARVLAARGWRSIEDVGPEASRNNLPNLARVFFTSR